MLFKYLMITIAISLASLPANAKEPLCSTPELLGSTLLPATPNTWTFEGNTGYILTGNTPDSTKELVIVDISDPANPTILSTTTLPDIATWLMPPVIHGSVLYAFDSEEFVIIDVSNPTLPTLSGRYAQPSSHFKIATIHANYLYLGSEIGISEVVDISLPHAPTFAAQWDHYPLLTVINGVGYTTRGMALDLTDPINPIELSDNPIWNGRSRTFHHDQDILYMLDPIMQSIDISNPTNPISHNSTQSELTHETAAFRGSLMFYVFNTSPWIHVRDISNPKDVYLIGHIEFDLDLKPIRGIHINNDIIYLLNDSSLFAYTAQTNPFVSTRHTLGNANDLVLTNNHAFVGTEGGNLQVFDITNPNDPTLVSTTPLASDAMAIDTKGDALYVATYRDNFNVFDISDPSNPIHVQNFDTGRRAMDAKVVGDLLYIVDRFEGLSIFDIQTPLNPQLLSATNTAGWSREITIDQANHIAYIASNKFNLQILDIANPAAPALIGTITPIDNIPDGSVDRGIETTTLDGNLLYTSEGAEGYRVFDVSNPSTPVELAQFSSFSDDGYYDYAHQLTIDGNQLLIANGTGGFAVYDNTDPMNPIQTQWLLSRDSQGSSSVRRIQLQNGLAYAAVYEGGLRIYDTQPCQPCTPDLNSDGTLDFFDVSDFLLFYAQANPAADFNADGTLDFFDVSDFLLAFATGCP